MLNSGLWAVDCVNISIIQTPLSACLLDYTLPLIFTSTHYDAIILNY